VSCQQGHAVNAKSFQEIIRNVGLLKGVYPLKGAGHNQKWRRPGIGKRPKRGYKVPKFAFNV
jgi:hypothetical protein